MRRSLFFTVMTAAFALGGFTLADNRLAAGHFVLGPGGSTLSVLDGVTYENITLFPIINGAGANTSGFMTLDEGLSNGDVVVSEMGSMTLRRSRDGRPMPGGGDEVNRLVLVNRGRKPLLLLAGELVSGGKQDRVIGKDRIVAPGAPPLPLDVFCVEHGRWTGGAEFKGAKVIVHPSVREQATVVQSQTAVWASVREATTAPVGSVAESVAAPVISRRTVDGVIAAGARSESYAKVYRESRLGQSADSFAMELERRFRKALGVKNDGRLVGVVVAYGGEVAWSDVFASNELLNRYWARLLRSYVTEALARPTTLERATVDEARDFIEPLRGREEVETEPSTYRWRQVTQGPRVEIELQALPAGPYLHTVNIRRTGR